MPEGISQAELDIIRQGAADRYAQLGLNHKQACAVFEHYLTKQAEPTPGTKKAYAMISEKIKEAKCKKKGKGKPMAKKNTKAYKIAEAIKASL
jgi:hypothetical protein